MDSVFNGADHHVTGNWDGIWALDLPPKILSFVWRLCRGNLPLGHNLNRRGMNVDVSCPICNRNYKLWSNSMLPREVCVTKAVESVREWVAVKLNKR
ncbi:conserved hypothetical protein [Ricinus communis]|uniref:Reverse transcriptase zinc-binding domain-containing protein n=1 Tax=Ricinus communis TaxID=3988 RepID=B9SUN7_RICCO|nr:conserved hypothetical protein [Ricinus communis]